SGWLNGGVAPVRLGNQHAAVVPYQDFTCADGEVLVAIGNDRQFRQFMALLGRDDLATDPRFASSPLRSGNRAALLAEMGETIAQWRAE
ncbi:CoA transferase, partial [Shewanella algae]|uniref:CoA transferase n=1 Tax=Shewanella algae TaxID=38313 RepID=UPI00313D8FB6